MRKINWGFLRETQKDADAAKSMCPENEYTALIDYLNVIFPEVNDWIHNKALGEINGVNYKIRPDYRSESLKMVVEFDGLPHFTNPETIEKDRQNTETYLSLGYDVVRIPYFIQLTNSVIKQMFNRKVKEEMFPAGVASFVKGGKYTPAYLCPDGISRMAHEFIKYPEQKEVNIEFLKSLNNTHISGVDALEREMERVSAENINIMFSFDWEYYCYSSEGTRVITNPALVSRLMESLYWRPNGSFKLKDQEIIGYSNPRKPVSSVTTITECTIGGKKIACCRGNEKWDLDDVRHKTFVENAHYLWERRERIFKDSRMLLAPIGTHLGAFGARGATLGTFLMWWEEFEYNTEDRLIVSFSGSPMSGSHSCSVVNSKGQKKNWTGPSFRPIWSSFAVINSRMAKATYQYEGYSICDVVDILKLDDYEEKLNKERITPPLRKI